MAALTAARVTKSKDLGVIRRYKMPVSTTIYAGGIGMINSVGLAVAATAAASNQGCPGVATATVVAPATGDTFVNLQEGTFLFGAVSIADTSVGLLVYGLDDQTVDETQLANQPVAGVLAEVVSATSGWVAMSLETARG